AATAHLLNGLKPSARVKKLIPPEHAPRLISALEDQSIPFPEEMTIESAVDNRYFIRQAAFPRTLDRLAAGAHAYLKAALRIAVVDAHDRGLHRRRAVGEVARLVENPFTAEVRFRRRVHKTTPKEIATASMPPQTSRISRPASTTNGGKRRVQEGQRG